MNFFLNTFNKFNKNFKIFKEINSINKKKPKFIFYSENKSYLKYGYLLIKYLAENYPGEVYYVSSDIEDNIKNLNVKNIFIGKEFFLKYFFLNVKTDNLFITLTDLDNSIIIRNKHVKNYVYYFHGAVSTTKVYTASAFDNYDTILCNGDYQYIEIKNREQTENLKAKKLIKFGFNYFDYLENKKNIKNYSNEILVAPSWNKNKLKFINEDFEKIIENIIKSGFVVRFRPHPETLKRSCDLMNFYKNKFKGSKFIFDDHPENLEAMEKAKCLITDNSGISIEYIMIFKKPVIYYNDFDKIHNDNFNTYKDLKTMDEIVKKKFGYILETSQINDIEKILNSAVNEFNEKEIDLFLEKNFYNFKNTINYLKNNISDICK